MAEIILIRHGATEYSASGLFCGREDVELSVFGKNQARAWRWLSRDSKQTTFLCSPLIRSQQTAEIAGVKNYLIEPSITEWDLGPLGGAHATTYRKDHPEWSLFDDGPPSPGETTESVIERARYFISNYLQDIGDERIVVFTHGQISKVICMLMLGQHPRYAVTYKIGPARAAILTGDFESGFVLSGWNFSALGTKSSANELLT